jgi:hypothetical protein
MVKLFLYRPWRPLELQEVEGHIFSVIRLTDGTRLSALRAGRFLPTGRFMILISVRGWVDSRAIIRLEGVDKLKKSTSSGTRTGHLLTCSMVPQPATLPRAPKLKKFVCYWAERPDIYIMCWRSTVSVVSVSIKQTATKVLESTN